MISPRLRAALRYGGVRQITADSYRGDAEVSGPTVFPDVCSPAPPRAR